MYGNYVYDMAGNDWVVNSYQNGPDTYLLQLRDVDFPVRLREYMKVAKQRCPMSRDYNDRDNQHIDWRVSLLQILVVIKILF